MRTVMSKLRRVALVAASGAAAAYFMDPVSGPARRASVLEQVRSLSGSRVGEPGSAGAGSQASTSGPTGADATGPATPWNATQAVPAAMP